MKGRYIIHVSCLTSVYLKTAKKLNLDNYLNITITIKLRVTGALVPPVVVFDSFACKLVNKIS